MWIPFLLTVIPSQDLTLSGAHILASSGDRWEEGQAVVVADGRIEGLEVAVEGVGEDAGGLWVIPGLIDLHSHLCLHPYDETSWNDQVLKESLELRTIQGCLLYTSPSPRDLSTSRMPSSA